MSLTLGCISYGCKSEHTSLGQLLMGVISSCKNWQRLLLNMPKLWANMSWDTPFKVQEIFLERCQRLPPHVHIPGPERGLLIRKRDFRDMMNAAVHIHIALPAPFGLFPVDEFHYRRNEIVIRTLITKFPANITTLHLQCSDPFSGGYFDQENDMIKELADTAMTTAYHYMASYTSVVGCAENITTLCISMWPLVHQGNASLLWRFATQLALCPMLTQLELVNMKIQLVGIHCCFLSGLQVKVSYRLAQKGKK